MGSTNSLRTESVSVYVVCEDCGLSAAETDELIEIMRESGKIQTRAELLASYAATFDESPADGSVPCDDCAEAVLDAAGVDTEEPHATMRTLGIDQTQVCNHPNVMSHE